MLEIYFPGNSTMHEANLNHRGIHFIIATELDTFQRMHDINDISERLVLLACSCEDIQTPLSLLRPLEHVARKPFLQGTDFIMAGGWGEGISLQIISYEIRLFYVV